MEFEGQIVDPIAEKIFPGKITVSNGKIKSVLEIDEAPGIFILPGLVDAHIHIESSMLIPSQFARIAIQHGTVATVSDPHEIANVLGVEGVDFMIDDAASSPLKFYFGAPSCVPATCFESAGAELGVSEVEALLDREEVHYLSEMMNYPGVLNEDSVVIQKIEAAKKRGKPIDGHAPGLRGADARRYASFGISTDHECFTIEEAQDKLDCGMKIIIREGSAAKNFDALIPLLNDNYRQMMLCSDDKHPDDLLVGHINQLLARAVAAGCDPVKAVVAATANPVRHYKLNVGLLQPGDPADFVVVNSLSDFDVQKTYIDGRVVFEQGKINFSASEVDLINNFNCAEISTDALAVKAESEQLRAIKILDSQIVTESAECFTKIEGGDAVSDPEKDLYKIVVVNRYQDSPPAVAFCQNVGLREGAFASSIAHDSHNIVAIGVGDAEIAEAINLVIRAQGGISVVGNGTTEVLELPIAGLMSDRSGEEVGKHYEKLDRQVKSLGCHLTSPYMTLSFLALLVIPSLKLSDKGLFDGTSFNFTSLWLN